MSSNDRNSPPPSDSMSRRRSSLSQAALSQLFQRSNSVSGQGGTSALPGTAPVSTGAIGEQRRRLSMTGAAGLPGTSPTATLLRRGSLSTNASEAIDENAVEEDDSPPRGSFQRRMSFGGSAGMRNYNNRVPPTPGTHDQGFNWTEQLRSRAESLTMATRPTFAPSTSPPRGAAPAPAHERSRSMAEMPPPPVQASSMRPVREAPRKPDAFQERILKGDFYMD